MNALVRRTVLYLLHFTSLRFACHVVMCHVCVMRKNDECACVDLCGPKQGLTTHADKAQVPRRRRRGAMMAPMQYCTRNMRSSLHSMRTNRRRCASRVRLGSSSSRVQRAILMHARVEPHPSHRPQRALPRTQQLRNPWLAKVPVCV